MVKIKYKDQNRLQNVGTKSAFTPTKFQGNRKLIAMESINCLNLSFCSLKKCIKVEFID